MCPHPGSTGHKEGAQQLLGAPRGRRRTKRGAQQTSPGLRDLLAKDLHQLLRSTSDPSLAAVAFLELLAWPPSIVAVWLLHAALTLPLTQSQQQCRECLPAGQCYPRSGKGIRAAPTLPLQKQRLQIGPRKAMFPLLGGRGGSISTLN